MKKKLIAATLAAGTILGLTACGTQTSDANVVSQNLSTAADQFQINRRIVFISTATNQVEFVQQIEGWCNIVAEPAQLEVTCKAGGGEYKKHFLGLNATTTYSVEQLESANVSPDHYKVIFKPSTIIPDVDIK